MEVTDAWRSATEAWEREAEDVAIGYKTELAEFASIKPRPRLKDFMVHLSRKEGFMAHLNQQQEAS